MTTPLISIENLSRRYGDKTAVQALGFELHGGEVVGLLGPNGAGKSTTMRLISGCLAPTTGRILLGGVDLHRQPEKAKRVLGYLPERPPLYPEMTVDEYLRHAARLRLIPRRMIGEAVTRVKRRCGLEGEGGRLTALLSKGYQQRVGIAQAIIHEPRIIILDEPTSGLDPNQIRDIRELVRSLGREHGVLISTHILPEVQALCNRVQIMHQGRLVFSGSLERDGRRHRRLTIRLGRPPAEAELLDHPGVEGVQPLGDGLFLVELADGTDPASLAESACGHGWQLQELSPKGSDLEEIFTRLTTGDDP